MTAKCKRNSTESTNQAQAVSLVVTVSVPFLILRTANAVQATFPHVIQLPNNPMYHVLMNFTQYLSHSINGVLYCIVGSRFYFRKEFFKIICRRKRPDDISAPDSFKNRSVVTISGTMV